MTPLKRLLEAGQSHWLDDLSRDMLRDDSLKRLVVDRGLRGITSNPKTFARSIQKSEHYDADLEELSGVDVELPAIYDHLMVHDVREACDVLGPIFQESDGEDGFVSLEVSPRLAHDTEATVAEARRLHRAVERPNVMIKVPGTVEGLPAIERLLTDGIPVNITLLFAKSTYEAVAEIYLRALEQRAEKDLPLAPVRSVASLFLSRIDVLVDPLVERRLCDPTERDAVRGQAGISCAKLVYRSFQERFTGPRWDALRKRGAKVQRPLWASTGTKREGERDVRYIEPLVGPHTVTTMPLDTLEAFADHGEVVFGSVTHDVDRAEATLQVLERHDISLDAVAWQLQHEGVEKFLKPYEEALAHLEKALHIRPRGR